MNLNYSLKHSLYLMNQNIQMDIGEQDLLGRVKPNRVGEQIKELYKDCKLYYNSRDLSIFRNRPSLTFKKFMNKCNKKEYTKSKLKNTSIFTIENSACNTKDPIIINDILYLFGIPYELIGISTRNDIFDIYEYPCINGRPNLYRAIICDNIFNGYVVRNTPSRDEIIYVTFIYSPFYSPTHYFFKPMKFPIIPVKGIQVLQLLNRMNILFEPLCKIIALEYFGTEFDDSVDFIQKMNS
jgi:hypothetical protein